MANIANKEKYPISENKLSLKGWLIQGLGWAVFMFLIMSIFYPWATNEPITTNSILIGILAWFLGGMGYGLTMYFFFGRKAKT